MNFHQNSDQTNELFQNKTKRLLKTLRLATADYKIPPQRDMTKK